MHKSNDSHMGKIEAIMLCWSPHYNSTLEDLLKHLECYDIQSFRGPFRPIIEPLDVMEGNAVIEYVAALLPEGFLI